MIAWYDGDGARADRLLDEALELVRDRPDSPVKVQALTVRGGTQLVKGNYQEAVRLGREALPLTERLGLEQFQARIFARIGTARVALGDADGIADLERGMEISRRIGSYEELHACWNNLGESQFLLGRVGEAVRTYEALMESLERFARDTDRRWGQASIAQLYTSAGRWDEAVSLIDAYIAEVEAGSPHYLESPARSARASIRLACGDLPGAAADVERAVAAGRAAGDSQVLAPALTMHAVTRLTEGRRAEAEQSLDDLLSNSAHVPALISGFGTAVTEMAWLARDLGREIHLLRLLENVPALPWIRAARAIASADLERAAEVLGETGSSPSEAYTCLRTAEQLGAAGEFEAAARHLEPAEAFYRRVAATRYLERCQGVRARLAATAAG